MTREEFLNIHQNHPYLDNIKNILTFLDCFPFLNIEFTNESVDTIEVSSQYKDKFNLNRNVVKLNKPRLYEHKQKIEYKSIVWEDITKEDKLLILEKLFEEIPNTMERQIIRKLFGSNTNTNIDVDDTNIKVNKADENIIICNANLATILQNNYSGRIFIDPYLKYSDNNFIVFKGKPTTIIINSLLNVNITQEDNLIRINISNNYKVIINENSEIINCCYVEQPTPITT